ncbi:GFA family protein [Vibrio navarrensis]|uniref:GFA family protein n=1 Tax=Vibrio navarrensis TaxID=29495 RepID=UPI003F4979A3
MHMITGRCHCGNVELSIPELTEAATSCNCSICSRYGAIWGYFTESDVEVKVGQAGLSSYCYGDKFINFNRCNECGCITHYTSTKPSPGSRLAVNYRMFPPSQASQVKVRLFDGADTWQFLD